MVELLTLVAIVVSALSGIPAAFVPRRGNAAGRMSAALMVVAAFCGIAAAIAVLRWGAREATWPWAVPGGAIALRIDALAAMFLIQIYALAALGSIYGVAYWSDQDHPEEGRKVRIFYGLTTAGMALLVVAKNAVLFLAGWEIMALAAFLLVSAEDRREEVRQSGLVYLVATRIGTLCLFAFFTLLRVSNGSYAFVAPGIDPAGSMATAMMLLALVGFGLKAGAMPLHLWLPGAHANAPTHVSALMSGVLIKMGIYGLARFASFFATPPAWWGALLLVAGAVSGVLGVLFAIGQHDIKRLLAYHSVENIGIILMGLGIGLLGRSYSDATLFALGIAGALLHVWNHGLFKALLFLSAGSVLSTTHTREIDQLGGLAKKMPWTALFFVTGAVAICGLPPLNGFISELFVYLGFLRAGTTSATELWMSGALSAPVLAFIGALAVACFVKVFGAVFLGEPRSDRALRARESPLAMLFPMGVLAVGCAVIGLCPSVVAPVLDRAIAVWPPLRDTRAIATIAPLSTLSLIGAVLTALTSVGLAWAWRAARSAPRTGTWDCGYAAPTARMQYTSSSFAEFIVGLFASILRPERHEPKIVELFPKTAKFEAHVPEIVLDRIVLPIVMFVARGLTWFRWVQRGAVQLYLLYVFATLIVLLLVWH
jgi:hydrogenase-4 component B